jgi:hypothetical protein
MIGIDTRIARGTVRRASRISSPRNDADSRPVSANAIVDQKTMSFRWVQGTSARAVKAVAEPSRT